MTFVETEALHQTDFSLTNKIILQCKICNKCSDFCKKKCKYTYLVQTITIEFDTI